MHVCSALSLSLLLALAAATAAAQQTSGRSAAAPLAPNPYLQQRSKGYTSFDNPYAPGAIYDPYHGHSLSAPTGTSGVKARTKSAQQFGLADSDSNALSGNADTSGGLDSMRANRCGASAGGLGSSHSGASSGSSQALRCGGMTAKGGSQGMGMKRKGQTGALRQGQSLRPSR